MLSQALINQLAQVGKAVMGTLKVSLRYDTKTHANVVTHTYTLEAYMSPYRGGALTSDLIAPGDQRVRLAVVDVPFTPSFYDEFTRQTDQTRWRVMMPHGGPGTGWWVLQARRVR